MADLGEGNADLVNRVAPLDASTEVLVIQGACPVKEQWEILSSHFHAVKKLYIDSGFDEHWDDAGFPEKWDLDVLVVGSAGSEVVCTPVINEGRVRALSFVFTTGLRFEGPSTKELEEKLLEDAAAGEEELDYAIHEARKARIPIISSYRLGAAWLREKYLTPTEDLAEEAPDGQEHDQPLPQLAALEIIENDSISAFCRFALANPVPTLRLQKLHIRATEGKQYFALPEIMFPGILADLDHLTHLELALNDNAFTDADIIPNLYENLPRNLEVLHFRGPCSLAFDPRFDEWIATFEVKSRYPALHTLSFVLDAYSSEGELPLEMLGAAKAACTTLLEAASKSGVQVVEEPPDPWARVMTNLGPIDPRWALLGTN
ncbi:hypothetical protein GQ53DRAFT_764419 [Thozetella sp. PMI_491]|nr:hypothetical protein GQ53DRAFT_764419 [Thozetella sp. PMI_491]